MSLVMELDSIKSEDSSMNEGVLACRGCLATGVKLHSLHEKGLGQLLGDFSGYPVVPTDSYPQLICNCCQYVLRKLVKFRMRCHSAMYVLQQMEIDNVKITTESLSKVDRTHLKHNLTKSETETINYDGVNVNESAHEKEKQEATDNKPIEECMINDIDLIEEDDKPLKHFVSAITYDSMLDTPKIKEDDYSDDGIDADVHTEMDDVPLKRKRVTRSSDIKMKRLKTEKAKKKSAKKSSNNKTTKLKLNKESETTIKTKNNKIKREPSNNEEQELLKTIANVLRKIWHENKNSNIAEIWDLVYQQSLSIKDEDVDDGDCKTLKKNASTKQQIIKFIELTRKLSKLYNMEVKFLSVDDHRKEIEERRASEKFANAPYKCSLCCKVYIFEDTYKRHMVSHDPTSGDVECEVCRYRFRSRKRYMNHFHIYHTKKIVCRECGVVNRAWNFAKQHYKWHGGVTTVCEQCGKHFSDKKLYCMHVRAVHRAELATALCLLCGDTYNGLIGLRMHVDKAHRQAARCTECAAMFRCTQALDTHTRAGCRPGDSSCPICGENFPREEEMRRHYHLHDNKEFSCEHCSKTLSTVVQYQRHRKKCLLPATHARPRHAGGAGGGAGGAGGGDGEKGGRQAYNLHLMCELCGKGNFKCFSTLRSHQRVHTGERPFHCDICQKSFRELQFLKNHLKTHTDERRYKCPFCHKAFRQMGHRAAHLLTHTKERPFGCTSCSKRYTGLTALKEHVNTAHRGLPPRQRGKHRDRQEL